MPIAPFHTGLRPTLFRMAMLLLIGSMGLSFIVPRCVAADDENSREAFFEAKVRPLLAQRCFKCHGPEKQQGAVRLDLRQDLFTPGEAGTLIAPGKPDESRLIQVIRYAPEDVQMPPDQKLTDAEIATLTQWVQSGAFWPKEETPHKPEETILRTAKGEIDFVAEAARHWSYLPLHPITPPPIPSQPDNSLRLNDVDAFTIEKLHAQKLSLSPPADRRTLIRRASIDLLGILPTHTEVEQFAQDDRPEAYAELIDRLLASPLYGQRWGRHWLDVARYADTKGYVFTENRFFPFSYTYRDYVINAFNEDKPYDQFILEQLAADRLDLPDNTPSLAAMGFLTVGRQFLNNTHDVIDDRIDLVTRGLMGMTVACARCHDHKYDPIPAADYYSLYGIFASTEEPEELPLIGTPPDSPGYANYVKELHKRERDVKQYVEKTRDEILTNLRTKSRDLLLGVIRDSKNFPEGATIPFSNGTPSDKLIQQWKSFVDRRVQRRDGLFRPWADLAALPQDRFEPQAIDALARLAAAVESQGQASSNSPRDESKRLNSRLIQKLQEGRPKSMLDVAILYGDLLSEVNAEWTKSQMGEGSHPTALEDADAEQIRRLLYGADSITDVPPGQESRIYERDQRDKLRELERKVAEWNVSSPDAPPRAMVLIDRPQPHNPVVFLRGDPNRRGDAIPRRAPRLLTGPDGETFANGSGRLELAKRIVDPDNPLTARVIVNRVWDWHFGQPLVRSTSDFGKRSDPPSHPELLDWLASTLIHQDHWSIKQLHRRIMLSATYQQQSIDRPDARQVDPENQLYWRANRRSLEFEAMRDSLLQAAGRLDTSLGGKPFDLEKDIHSSRRTVYALIDRNNFSSLLRTFDFPTPDVSSPGRTTTSVPQQTLFALNSQFLQRVSQDITKRAEVVEAATPVDKIRVLYQLILQRAPTHEEVTAAESFLSSTTATAPLQQFAQALLVSNEFQFID